MAVLPNNNPTLADWVKTRDPDGTIADVAEILNQDNEILDDATFLPANGSTGHQVTVQTSLPDVYWRQFNQGVKPSKGTTAQVTEGIGMLEARSQIDAALATLEDDLAAFRRVESQPFIEGMNQEMAATLFYGNTAITPQKFMGLAARMSQHTNAGNSSNVLDAGGTTAATQTSIYLVGWGPQGVFCTFPKGSMAGLEQSDLGLLDVPMHDSAGAYDGFMRAYVEWFCWKNGLVVKDWRFAARIANLEVSDLIALSGTQALTGAFGTNLLHVMSRAVARLPSFGGIRPAFYVNRTVYSALSRMAMEKSSAALSLQDGHNQFGTYRQYMTFLSVPIRRCDSILNTEAVVAA